MLPSLTPRGKGKVVPPLNEDDIALIMDSMSLSNPTSVHHHAVNIVLDNEVGGHSDKLQLTPMTIHLISRHRLWGKLS